MANKVEDRITLHRSREGTHEVTVSRVVETTECDKLAAVSGDSQKIGDFLAWCGETHEAELCVRYKGGDHLQPIGISVIALLAQYFEIDLQKVETERRALLDALRESHR